MLFYLYFRFRPSSPACWPRPGCRRTFADGSKVRGRLRPHRRAGQPAHAGRRRPLRRQRRGHPGQPQRPLRPAQPHDAALAARWADRARWPRSRSPPTRPATPSRTPATRPASASAARSPRRPASPRRRGSRSSSSGSCCSATNLALIGVALFAAIVLFQVVTLPVEFGASRKAMVMLTDQGVISQAPGAGRPQGADRRRADLRRRHPGGRLAAGLPVHADAPVSPARAAPVPAAPGRERRCDALYHRSCDPRTARRSRPCRRADGGARRRRHRGQDAPARHRGRATSLLPRERAGLPADAEEDRGAAGVRAAARLRVRDRPRQVPEGVPGSGRGRMPGRARLSRRRDVDSDNTRPVVLSRSVTSWRGPAARP